MNTNSEKSILFRSLQLNRELDGECQVLKGVHIEHDLILLLTEKDPTLRPSAKQLMTEFLPMWRM